MTLYLHRSNRTELLFEEMAAAFDAEPLPPLSREWIVVDGRGMERWLSLQLARRNGVFANPGFVFPRRIVLAAMDAVLGADAGAEAGAEVLSRYEPEVMMWAVASLLPALLGQEAFAPIARYLDTAEPGSRRLLRLAERIARTFDDYVLYRPQMILGWERRPVEDQALPADQRWQPVLWRALTARLGQGHMAARAAAFFAAVERGTPLEPSFARRLSLFGLSTTAPLYLRILTALQRQIDLHLYVLEPTEHYWSDLKSQRESFALARRQGRPEEELFFDVGHPLLASLGKQGRDFRIVLDELLQGDIVERELFVSPGHACMLHVLQADILALAQRGAPTQADGPASDDSRHLPALTLEAADRSISIHDCHSAMREIEVLHDQLLDLLATDPTLSPADIVVMAPDIDAYAPYIDAVFGAAREDHWIRYSLADRGVRATHALVDALFKLLDTLRGRLGAAEVLDLLSCSPVRARFGIAQEDLGLIARWVEQTGVRFAADAAHRAALGHPATDQNTWRFGLDRLLLGLAMPLGERDLFAGVLPYDDVEGSAADILGKLASYGTTLFAFRGRLAEARTVSAWFETLTALLDAMVATTDGDEHQHAMVVDACTRLVERAQVAGFAGAVDLDAMRAQLEALLEAGRSGRGFLQGGVTFCSTVPMRAIPFRVVCLLGMNDESFPRRSPAPGFDLLAARHLPGDRKVRDDDRYVFLEALLSARDHFIVTYQGHSIRDNAARPPSVVVAELCDAVAEAFVVAAPRRSDSNPPEDQRQAVRSTLVRCHPLTAYSPAYFRADDDRLFSFSRHARDLAQVLAAERGPRPAFVDGSVAPLADQHPSVSLQDLLRFFKQPTALFLRRSAGLMLDEDRPSLEETEPIELTGLEQWQIFDPALRHLAAGASTDAVARLLRASGRLPLGVFGDSELAAGLPLAAALVAAGREVSGGAPLEDLELAVDLGSARVTGLIRGLWSQGLVQIHYGKARGHHQLALWLRHLALNCAAPPHHPRTSALVARDAGTGAPTVIRFRPVDQPVQRLERLVHIYQSGLCTALPLFKLASWAFASTWWQSGQNEGTAYQAARKAFAGNPYVGIPGDQDDVNVRQVFAGLDPLAPDIGQTASAEHTPYDFKALALEVFEPMLAHREVEA